MSKLILIGTIIIMMYISILSFIWKQIRKFRNKKDKIKHETKSNTIRNNIFN